MKTNTNRAKKVLSLFAMLMPLQASAHDFEVDGIYYNITSETDRMVAVTFKGDKYNSYSNEYSSSVTLPATVTYDDVAYSVTSIGSNAFKECISLQSIILPKSITSIGKWAFSGCSSLTAVYISSIEAWCRISFGDSHSNPLYYAHNLHLNGELITELVIPEGVTSIGNYAFSWCSSLTAITIPEGVTSIGNSAFSNCSSLTSITIPEGVTSIGNNAFHNCSSLTAITLPEGVTSIGNNAFYKCSSLTAITIPESVTSIGEWAFRDCSSLTAITIPEGVTSIGEWAFRDCSSLTAITIPEGMTSIGEQAFSGCGSLTAVYISSIEAWCRISFGDSYSNPLYYAHNLHLNGELITELVIPEGVTSIGNSAFSNCSSLTNITLPEGVTSIGNSAFSNCSSLTNITLPEGVTSIGNSAFSWCSSITAITIPEGVTSIGNYAFSWCSSLTAITLPESVTSIGDHAFRGCSSLTAITFHENSQLASIEISTLSVGSSLKELTLGKGLKKIEAGAFSSCTALEKITIYATQPPTTDGYIFSDATYENATLYVPQGCASKYQVMTGWSGFYNISEIESITSDYLTLRQADNGAVGIAVDLGRTYKVRITPSEGWKIHSVTFNGTDITAQLKDDNTLTTPTINGSSELVVAYEKDGSAISNTQAKAIKVQGHRGTLRITGATEGETIDVYTTSGTLVTREAAKAGDTEITLPEGQVYIVTVADKVVKIGM